MLGATQSLAKQPVNCLQQPFPQIQVLVCDDGLQHYGLVP